MKDEDDMAESSADEGNDVGGSTRGENVSRRAASTGKKKGKNSGEVDCWRRHVGDVEIGGVRQEIISESELANRKIKRKINRWYMGKESFLLDDGSYAYRDCNHDVKGQPIFYRVVYIEDEELKKFISGLHAIDREEGKSYRKYCLHQDFGYENYKRKQADEDSDDGWVDPIDINEAISEEDDDLMDTGAGDESRPFPLRSEYAVIRAVLKRMTPAEREVYRMLFDRSCSEMEIKQMLRISDSAWTNRKNRFLGAMKDVFDCLGYDTAETAEYVETSMDEMEDVTGNSICDLEEQEGDIDYTDYTNASDDVDGTKSTADEKDTSKKDEMTEDYWRREIRSDIRQEGRRDRWI